MTKLAKLAQSTTLLSSTSTAGGVLQGFAMGILQVFCHVGTALPPNTDCSANKHRNFPEETPHPPDAKHLDQLNKMKKAVEAKLKDKEVRETD
jgi:hypothetical protein